MALSGSLGATQARGPFMAAGCWPAVGARNEVVATVSALAVHMRQDILRIMGQFDQCVARSLRPSLCDNAIQRIDHLVGLCHGTKDSTFHFHRLNSGVVQLCCCSGCRVCE